MRRLRPLLTLAGLELDLCPLGEGPEALAGDVGLVDEEILRTLVRAEALALRIVEPLDGSGCHENTSLPITANG
jgi:hypothetical protein